MIIIEKLSFMGIRKLNWVERYEDVPFRNHLKHCGIDEYLNLGEINIIIGPNGGGKTTFLDIFRSLSNFRILGSLPRENYPGADFSFFEIWAGGRSIRCDFSRYLPDEVEDWKLLKQYVSACSRLGDAIENGPQKAVLSKEHKVTSDWVSFSDFLSGIINFKVSYKSPHYEDSPKAMPTKDLVKELILIAGQLPSVCTTASFPAFVEDGGRIGILFKDDTSQHSYVLRENLPAGWRQIAYVNHWLRARPEKSLVLLDEPDAHLHPSLQRVVLSEIAKIAKERRLQVIIATHSPVLINPRLTERHGAKVFLAAHGRVVSLAEGRSALDALGVRSSDFVHANGVIWVEGPSDRLYIAHWLSLYNDSIGRELVEGVDFVFGFYGGATIKHVSLTNDGGRLPLRSINRNYFFVIDSDISDADGRIGPEKQRILEEAIEIGGPTSVWITQEYTIENYLPGSYSAYILMKDGRTSVKMNKVTLAERFVNAEKDFSLSFKMASDLPAHIARLSDEIMRWQTPQENIDAEWSPSNPMGTIGRPSDFEAWAEEPVAP